MFVLFCRLTERLAGPGAGTRWMGRSSRSRPSASSTPPDHSQTLSGSKREFYQPNEFGSDLKLILKETQLLLKTKCHTCLNILSEPDPM